MTAHATKRPRGQAPSSWAASEVEVVMTMADGLGVSLEYAGYRPFAQQELREPYQQVQERGIGIRSVQQSVPYGCEIGQAR